MLTKPPWANRWLLAGVTMPVLLHMSVLYTPALAKIFQLAPLTKADWYTVAPSSPARPHAHATSPHLVLWWQVHGRRLLSAACIARGDTQAWREDHEDRVSERTAAQEREARWRRRIYYAAHIGLLDSLERRERLPLSVAENAYRKR